MKIKSIYFLLLIIVLALNACRKDVDIIEVEIIEEEIIPDTLVRASFTGQVLDENLQPLSEVTVSFGSESTFTNRDGLYQLIAKETQRKGAILKIEHPDYFASAAVNQSGVEQLAFSKTALVAKAITAQFSAVSGGELILPEDVKLAIPAGSLQRADGNTYTGEVQVATDWKGSTTQTTADIFTLPTSAKDANGKTVVLEKFAGLQLALTAEDGSPLQLESEESMELDIPVAETVTGELPEEVGLYRWDFGTGEWEFIALCLLKTERRYHCTVTGGAPSNGIFVCATTHQRQGIGRRVLNPDSTPVAYAQIQIKGVSDNFLLHTFTDNLGYFRAFVPQDMELEIIVFDNCTNEVARADLLDRGSIIRNIFLPETVNEYTVYLEGQVQPCVAATEMSAQIIVEWAGHQKAYVVNADGSYQIGVQLSCTTLPLFTVRAYNLTTRERSDPQLILPENDTPYPLETFTPCVPVEFYLQIDTDTAQYDIYPATFCIGEYPETNNLEIRTLNYAALFRSQLTYDQPTLYTDVAADVFAYNANFTEYETIAGRLNIIQIDIIEDTEDILMGTFSGIINREAAEPISVTGTYRAQRTF